MVSDCLGGLEKPRLPCCEMVITSVGMGFGYEVPCICLVVRNPAFLATGLNIHDIFSMYPVCRGVLPVGPDTADPCKAGLWRRPNCSRKSFLFQESIGKLFFTER
ncbi:hypothetical protein GQ55_9G139700 [Panicum hallii var. hallii]|uniref:Bifunctional inhibitor/plant lipid transfer protein/seed storage helical domain-containing protein n=1 Tax=Panicum hallii var. hallii TaxID=1504633 RepID=A0A2T7C2V8_9POAL|nr:hypothetical protein GQ55_9G139700 [Panicum hallii var. hallii]